jgi:hypothetical protein
MLRPIPTTSRAGHPARQGGQGRGRVPDQRALERRLWHLAGHPHPHRRVPRGDGPGTGLHLPQGPGHARYLCEDLFVPDTHVSDVSTMEAVTVARSTGVRRTCPVSAVRAGRWASAARWSTSSRHSPPRGRRAQRLGRHRAVLRRICPGRDQSARDAGLGHGGVAGHRGDAGPRRAALHRTGDTDPPDAEHTTWPVHAFEQAVQVGDHGRPATRRSAPARRRPAGSGEAVRDQRDRPAR